MRFTVGSAAGFVPRTLPDLLEPSLVPYPTYQPDRPLSRLVLFSPGAGGVAPTMPQQLLINGVDFDVRWGEMFFCFVSNSRIFRGPSARRTA